MGHLHLGSSWDRLSAFCSVGIKAGKLVVVGICSGMNGLIIFFLINGRSVLVLDIGTGARQPASEGRASFVGMTFFLRNTLLMKPLSSTKTQCIYFQFKKGSLFSKGLFYHLVFFRKKNIQQTYFLENLLAIYTNGISWQILMHCVKETFFRIMDYTVILMRDAIARNTLKRLKQI